MTQQQIPLPFLDTEQGERARLVARWSGLVRDVLPSMATRCRWPISRDHCFMRVCLDIGIGQPWHLVVMRPAVKHLTDAQLLAAIHVAEELVLCPDTLDVLNQRSIRWRKEISAAAKLALIEARKAADLLTGGRHPP